MHGRMKVWRTLARRRAIVRSPWLKISLVNSLLSLPHYSLPREIRVEQTFENYCRECWPAAAPWCAGCGEISES